MNELITKSIMALEDEGLICQKLEITHQRDSTDVTMHFRIAGMMTQRVDAVHSIEVGVGISIERKDS